MKYDFWTSLWGKYAQFSRLSPTYDYCIVLVRLRKHRNDKTISNGSYNYDVVDYIWDLSAIASKTVNINELTLVDTKRFDDSLEIVTVGYR